MTGPVPPRVAADRAERETRELIHAARSVVVGLGATFRDLLAGAYEAVEVRGDTLVRVGDVCDEFGRRGNDWHAEVVAAVRRALEASGPAPAWREHAEADHAALQRIGAKLREWNWGMAQPGMDPVTRATLANACAVIKTAIDGPGEGREHAEPGLVALQRIGDLVREWEKRLATQVYWVSRDERSTMEYVTGRLRFVLSGEGGEHGSQEASADGHSVTGG